MRGQFWCKFGFCYSRKVWVMRGYGLREVWVKRGSTVFRQYSGSESLRLSFLVSALGPYVRDWNCDADTRYVFYVLLHLY